MSKAALTLRPAPEGRTLLLTGRLDAEAAAKLWRAMTRALAEKPRAIDLSGVQLLDSAGAILLLRAGDDVPVLGAAPDVLAVLERNRAALKAAPAPSEAPSMRPGMSAMTNRPSGDRSTMPRLGARVVKG